MKYLERTAFYCTDIQQKLKYMCELMETYYTKNMTDMLIVAIKTLRNIDPVFEAIALRYYNEPYALDDQSAILAKVILLSKSLNFFDFNESMFEENESLFKGILLLFGLKRDFINSLE